MSSIKTCLRQSILSVEGKNKTVNKVKNSELNFLLKRTKLLEIIESSKLPSAREMTDVFGKREKINVNEKKTNQLERRSCTHY